MQVERMEWSLLQEVSGGRVSNTWATCLVDRDNTRKRVLIPNSFFARMSEDGKVRSDRDQMGPRRIS
jgi:hypothetical protein